MVLYRNRAIKECTVLLKRRSKIIIHISHLIRNHSLASLHQLGIIEKVFNAIFIDFEPDWVRIGYIGPIIAF